LSNELKLFANTNTQSGLTVTANVYDGDGVSIGDNIACGEVGTLAIYLGDMPSASAGRYYVRFFDGSDLLAQAPIDWDGSKEITLADISNVSGTVDANIKYVNNVLVAGTGEQGNEWGPA